MVNRLKTLIPLSIKKATLNTLRETKRYVFDLHQLYHDLQTIRDLKLNKSLRRKIRNTRLFTFYFRRYNKKKNIAKIVGKSVRFNYFTTLYGLFREIYINQCYWFTTDIKDPVIIDCGSHLGQSVLYFKALYPEAKITCFEPDDYTFSLLQKNIDYNNFDNVEKINKAVSDYDGEIDFYNFEDNKGSVVMSTVKERVIGGKKNVVEATRLSHYITDIVNFLKMDIEGAELSVLKELIKSNKLKFIKQMAIEYHHNIKDRDDNFSHILELLEENDFGYQIESEFYMPRREVHFQDILIYAYNKKLLYYY